MKKFLFFSLTLIMFKANAQTYKKTYGGTGADYASDIAATKDGGNIMVGDTYSFGLVNSDMLFVKTDAGGNVQWSKTLGGADYDHANAVIQTRDGGYAVAGSSGGNNNRAALVKLDANGNAQWVRYYSANTRQSASSVVQLADGGYAIAGQTSTYNNGSWGYLVRTDSLGNLVWSKLIFSRNFYPEIIDMTLTSDGGFALAAIFPSPAYYDMFLIKLNSTGNFEWGRSIGGSSTDVPSFVKQTRDGGYLMGGFAFAYGPELGQDLFVVKTTSNGTLQWAKNIGTPKSEAFTDAFEIPGGFVIAGTTDSAANFIRRPMLVRIKSNGTYQGARIYNDIGDVGLGGVTTYSNEGFSIAGAYGSSFGGNQEIYLAKFDRQGKTCGTFTNFGTVKDTGELVVQNIPVTNANTAVAAGGEVTIARTITTTDLCTNGVFASSGEDATAFIAGPAEPSVRLSPNPATNLLQLQWQSPENNKVTVSIYSVEGKQYIHRVYQAIKGSNLYTLPVNSLQSGMYVVRLSDGKEIKTVKFMKQ